MGETLAILALVLFSANTIMTKLASAKLNMNTGFLISVWVNVLFAAVLFLIQMIFLTKDTFNGTRRDFYCF